MRYQREINEEYKNVDALGGLIEIYGEIAAVRMKKTRSKVLKNRDFVEGINDIFKDTLASYAKRLSDLYRLGLLKKTGRVTFLAHNGKTVSVFLSANTGFYGEVVKRTYRTFLTDIRNSTVEVVIIGRLGRSLFLQDEPRRPYTYFDMPDYGSDVAKLAELIRHLVQYEAIRVYYGKYFSVVNQKPTQLTISAGTEIATNAASPKHQFIFEPSVEKILMFFETEIFASLFDQAIRESQLAKFASRILAMDLATQNIQLRLKALDLEKMRSSHTTQARKQLNSLSTVLFR